MNMSGVSGGSGMSGMSGCSGSQQSKAARGKSNVSAIDGKSINAAKTSQSIRSEANLGSKLDVSV